MNNTPRKLSVGLAALLAAGPAVLSSGCDDGGEVRVYSAPRDVTAPVAAEAPQPQQGAGQQQPAVLWAVPDGWKELPPAQMRYAAFAVSADHPDVMLTVVPLPRSANPLLANVNRWEGQLGLPNSAEADLPKVVTDVGLSEQGVTAHTVDLSGKDPGSGSPRRMLAAMVPHEDTSWFFKLVGPPEVVGAQKANFDAFLRSVHFHADDGHAHEQHAAGEPSAAAPAAPAGAVRLAWDKLPDGWDEGPKTEATALRAHTLRVRSGNEEGEVAVTRIRQEQAGSGLDNINRWRTAVGLENTTDPTTHPPRPTTVAGKPGVIMDIAGPGKDGQGARRVLVAMTDLGDDFWFFKFQGPAGLVESQKAAFESFLKSARFAGETNR